MSDLNNFWSGFGCHTHTHTRTLNISTHALRACVRALQHRVGFSVRALQVLRGFAPHKRAHSRINCNEGRANATEHTHTRCAHAHDRKPLSARVRSDVHELECVCV